MFLFPSRIKTRWSVSIKKKKISTAQSGLHGPRPWVGGPLPPLLASTLLKPLHRRRRRRASSLRSISHATQRAAGILLRRGEEPLLPCQGTHPRRLHPPPSASDSPDAATRRHSGMQQEEGGAAGAAQRQGDVRRRGHLLR